MEVRCGCFISSHQGQSLTFESSRKGCSLVPEVFICCGSIGYTSRQICCIDKHDHFAPSFVDKCRMTNQQFDSVEKLFGADSVAFHRSIYKKNFTDDDYVSAMQKSNLMFILMMTLGFFTVPVLMVCAKVCLQRLDARISLWFRYQQNEMFSREPSPLPAVPLNETYSLPLASQPNTLVDMHSFVPVSFVFQPPPYSTTPKEPPKYSTLFPIIATEINGDGGNEACNVDACSAGVIQMQSVPANMESSSANAAADGRLFDRDDRQAGREANSTH
ncbi:hypothetical protein HELRODRAFT_164800 [Helobdella robusta]|uniref:Uncharacterized protein n=1 Tax=Helobdella robusta TaxID=6412 RepID=T1EVT8_HELRO|nr:hypothetical protein HELRODRAFT_164800 [Helobdella robusta]ESN92704.1 hypothetical protein HELRODRAFT_164800 [Helobdella robusta]